jgi:hypothetical protein
MKKMILSLMILTGLTGCTVIKAPLPSGDLIYADGPRLYPRETTASYTPTNGQFNIEIKRDADGTKTTRIWEVIGAFAGGVVAAGLF